MKVTSIFYSIDGEVNFSNRQGMLATFVRLAGCNLRCNECDTVYSYGEGKEMTVDEVIKEVKEMGCPKLSLTGGEPCVQMGAINELIKKWLALDVKNIVSVETNGSVPISNMIYAAEKGHKDYAQFWTKERERISIVMDFKGPSSGMQAKMYPTFFENLNYMLAHDWIKIVIGDRKDYEEALAVIRDYEAKNIGTIQIALSPKFGKIEERQIVDWMKGDKLFYVTLQNQMHKIWWPELATTATAGKEV